MGRVIAMAGKGGVGKTTLSGLLIQYLCECGKKPVLAVEVDGYDYHGETTGQAARDLKKDHILDEYGIPLLRFKTNGSGEKETILETLERLVE